MNKSLSELHLAAYAAAALPGTLVSGLCQPHLYDEQFAMQGVRCEDGTKLLVLLAHNRTVTTDLQAQQPLLEVLSSAYRHGTLNFAVPDYLGDVTTRANGYAVVSPHFGEGILAQSHEASSADPLSGSLFNVEIWAEPLGRALGSLHKLPIDLVCDTGIPVASAKEAQSKLLAALDEATSTAQIPSLLAHRWEQGLEDVSLWHFSPALIHKNLAPTCVFGSSRGIVGIVDWAEACVGDPAVDIASVLSGATPAFSEKFWQAYRRERRAGIDAQIERRVDLMAELALLQWLLHGVHTGDQDIIDDAVSMMKELTDAIIDEEGEGSPDGDTDFDPVTNEPLEDVPTQPLDQRHRSHIVSSSMPSTSEADATDMATTELDVSDKTDHRTPRIYDDLTARKARDHDEIHDGDQPNHGDGDRREDDSETEAIQQL